MTPPKTSRLRYTLLKSQSSSLQDRLDYRPLDRKTRFYKNCFIGFFIIIILHCSYRYIWLSDEISNSVRKSEDTLFLTITTTTPKRRQMLPKCIKKLRYGPTKLNLSTINISDVEHEYPMVKDGGYYSPTNCSSEQKIAIIVTYQSWPLNLAVFLYNMHSILMKQKLEYQIFTIEQAGNDLYNKGCLYNVGIKEALKLKKFSCIIFHDLHLLPMSLKIQYTCSTLPRQMSSFIDDGSPRKPGEPNNHKSLCGGVLALSTEMVSRINGYSNVYFGWGGEDNDMFWRLRAAGYLVEKYNTTVGIYTMLPHITAPTNNYRYSLLATTIERYKVEGLSSLEYVILKNMSHHLYTHILVDINPRKQNVTTLMLKWIRSNNTL